MVIVPDDRLSVEYPSPSEALVITRRVGASLSFEVADTSLLEPTMVFGGETQLGEFT